MKINMDDFTSKLVFIHYASCTFGSTLFHLLMKSGHFQQYDEFKHDNMYTENKTAHNGTINVIEELHSFRQILNWKNLNYEGKKLFLEKNTLDIVKVSDLYQPPLRIAHFDCFYEIKEFFKDSKHIVITFNENNIELLTDMYIRKLKPEVGFNFKPQISKLYNTTKNNTVKENIERKYNQDLFNYYLEKLNNINLADADFVFPFDDFFTYEKFALTSNLLFDNLKIDNQNTDLKVFWDNFYNNNLEFFKR